MNTFSQFILVGVGGATGSMLRFLVYMAAKSESLQLESYYATFFVNILGSLLIGLLAGWLSSDATELRTLILIGALGGFTTFSNFSFDLLQMLQNGNWPQALGFALASVIFGLAAAFIGFRLAVLFMGAPS